MQAEYSENIQRSKNDECRVLYEKEEQKKEEQEIKCKQNGELKQPLANKFTMNQLMDESQFNVHEYEEIAF